MGAVLSPTQMTGLRVLNDRLGRPDAYRIKRPGPAVPDGHGGSMRPLVTVEAGDCLLRQGTTRPDERLIAERMQWTTPYTVSLPVDTTLTPADTLEVNGRTFSVGGVLRGGYYATSAVAVCEERG